VIHSHPHLTDRRRLATASTITQLAEVVGDDTVVFSSPARAVEVHEITKDEGVFS
jgi:hypothetical protein